MENTTVVRKSKRHRAGIWAFSMLALAVTLYAAAALRAPEGFLLCVPVLLIGIPFALYDSTWQLRLEEKHIVKRLFFREISRYSYVQLRKVRKRYCTSEGNYRIEMIFVDGKRLQFRMDDECAGQAEKKLQRHCSIVTG